MHDDRVPSRGLASMMREATREKREARSPEYKSAGDDGGRSIYTALGKVGSGRGRHTRSGVPPMTIPGGCNSVFQTTICIIIRRRLASHDMPLVQYYSPQPCRNHSLALKSCSAMNRSSFVRKDRLIFSGRFAQNHGWPDNLLGNCRLSCTPDTLSSMLPAYCKCQWRSGKVYKKNEEEENQPRIHGADAIPRTVLGLLVCAGP